MRLRTKIFLGIFLLAVGLFGWAAYYAQDKGFGHEWRASIESEFANRGVYLTLRRLNLDPIRGLIAKDVEIFEDSEHEILLMSISQIALDIDLGRLIRKEMALRAFDIRNAKVSIPLDPGRKLRGEQLRLENLSARILLPADRIEIVRAEAGLHGIQLVLKGSLFRPLKDEKDDEEEKDSPTLAEEQEIQLRTLRKRGKLIGEVLKPINELEFDWVDAPRIELEVSGDLAKPEEIRARGSVRSGGLGYRDFQCESIDAEFELGEGRLTCRHLTVTDEHGRLTGGIEIDLERREMDFSLDSKIDLHSFLSSVVDAKELGEVVFYRPPHLVVSGVYRLGQPFSSRNLPLKVIGSLRSDRLTSRGVIFDALSFDFSVDGPNLYVRDARLEHQSGLLSGEILRRDQEVNYRAEMRLHPTAFKPFVALESNRQFLNRWTFHDNSAVFVTIEGFGPSLRPQDWTSKGSVDLRNCALNGHPIDHLQARLEFEGKQHHFRNLVISREGGMITGKHVLLDHEAQRGVFEGIEGQIFPAHAVGWFAPNEVDRLLVYDFHEPPLVALRGEMDLRPPSARRGEIPRHDYYFSFATDGTATYKLLGQDLLLEKPAGAVHILGHTVTLSGFQAGTLGGGIRAEVEVERVEEAGPAYRVDVVVDEVDFSRLAELYSNHKDTGGALTGSLTIEGRGADVHSITGSGEAKIVGGDVFSIPAFGPLSKPVKDTLPRIHDDFSIAREANLSFSFEDGKFRIDAFEAQTNTFQMEGSGDIDLATSALDLEATMHLRGVAAPILKPVSKFFVFKGTGTVSEPKWGPKGLPNPIRDIGAAAGSAIREAGEQLPKLPKLPKLPLNLPGPKAPPSDPDAN